MYFQGFIIMRPVVILKYVDIYNRNLCLICYHLYFSNKFNYCAIYYNLLQGICRKHFLGKTNFIYFEEITLIKYIL